MVKGEKPIINGDGKQTRDYVYIGDIVDANKRALTTKVIGSFNIGTGIETNVIEIYERIKSHSRATIRAIYGSAKQGEQRRSCLDCSKAMNILDWQAKTPLDEGLKITYQYFNKS